MTFRRVLLLIVGRQTAVIHQWLNRVRVGRSLVVFQGNTTLSTFLTITPSNQPSVNPYNCPEFHHLQLLPGNFMTFHHLQILLVAYGHGWPWILRRDPPDSAMLRCPAAQSWAPCRRRRRRAPPISCTIARWVPWGHRCSASMVGWH